jgi:hypothetical protein
MILFAVRHESDLAMRGSFQDRTGLFSYILLEERVPENHPLRGIRELVRAVLIDMNKEFAALYSDEGRPSIPPEQSARPHCCFRRFTACGRNAS